MFVFRTLAEPPAEEVTVDGLLQRNDELSQYVNMLTEVLTEASGEITTLKERIAQAEIEIEEKNRSILDLSRRVVESDKAGGGADASVGAVVAVEAGTTSPARAPSAPPVADGSPVRDLSGAGNLHTLQAELHALRENYHRAMTTNDALRADVEDLQSQLAAAAEASADLRRRPSVSIPDDSDLKDSLSTSIHVFAVLENERYFPIGGWSTQTLISDWCASCSESAPCTRKLA